MLEQSPPIARVRHPTIPKLSASEFSEFNNYQNEDRYLLILFFSLHASSYSGNSIIL
jgi:hypothetical protein